MNFLKSLFGKRDLPIRSYADFWNWFALHEKKFFKVVHEMNEREVIERLFFNVMGPKLDELKKGYFYLTGVYDDHTVELILTADGNIGHIVFVEELVAAAPAIPGWKFTALKPPAVKPTFSISMGDYAFNTENLHFYGNDHPDCPDEIDIVIIYDLFTEDSQRVISNGVNIFLDNYLGELDYVNDIDGLTIIGPSLAQKELIPMDKLKDYLHWRQKEFIEKYEGARYDTSNDEYAILETELSNGNMAIANINMSLLQWDRKASHLWIAKMTIRYDGSNRNGMPDKKDSEGLNYINNQLQLELTPETGQLYIGRETADGERDVYFACKDFRQPSKVFLKAQRAFSKNFKIEYDIYKDKYWQTFTRFVNAR